MLQHFLLQHFFVATKSVAVLHSVYQCFYALYIFFYPIISHQPVGIGISRSQAALIDFRVYLRCVWKPRMLKAE